MRPGVIEIVVAAMATIGLAVTSKEDEMFVVASVAQDSKSWRNAVRSTIVITGDPQLAVGT